MQNNSGEQEKNSETLAREPELNRAVLRRLEEFQKLRRDLIGRLAETGALMEQRAARCRTLLAELDAGKECVIRHQTEIEQLKAENWAKEHLQSELGMAMRKLENCRLELLTRMAKINEIEPPVSSRENSPTSLKPELNSLTFRQVFRFGLAFMLPSILSLLAGAAVVAMAFFLAMRV